jgi:lysophospholipase L1-like esterase
MKKLLLLLLFVATQAACQNRGIFSAYDPDAIDYFNRVTAAGGTLSAATQSHVTNLVRDLKRDGNWAGMDIAPFLGGFSGCFVKLNYINSSYKELINTSFVSGDYGATTGLTNSGGSKKFDSQIVPDDNGLSYQNLSYCVFVTDQFGSGTIVVGDAPASGGETVYMGKTYIGTKGGTLQSSIPDYGTGTDYFLQMSLGSSETIFRRDAHDLLPPSPNATTPPSQALANSLCGSLTKSFGSNVNGTGSYAMYIIGPYKTRNQLRLLNIAVRKFLAAEGRITEKPQLITFGDSNTYGTGASIAANRYSKILASYFGIQERNLGIGGTLLTTSASALYSGYDRRSQILDYNVTHPLSKVIIQYGTNDMRADPLKGTTGTASLVTTFTANLVTIIHDLVVGGVAPQNIQVGSIIINNEASVSTTCENLWVAGCRQAVLDVYSTYGIRVKYYDANADLTANGGTANLDVDNLHLNDTGHARLAYGHYYLAVYL